MESMNRGDRVKKARIRGYGVGRAVGRGISRGSRKASGMGEKPQNPPDAESEREEKAMKCNRRW